MWPNGADAKHKSRGSAKDPDPIYLRASFFRAAAAGNGLVVLLAVLLNGDGEVPAEA